MFFELLKGWGQFFFNSGWLISSGDMCPQIKSIYFLVLLPQNRVKNAQFSRFCWSWYDREESTEWPYWWWHTCLPNQNDVFWIGQKVRPVFFNSGQPIGSGDMCPQIKSIYFLVLLPKNRSKSHKNGLKMSWFGMVWFGMARLWSKLVWSEKINHSCLL